jgi:hypothetical protein
VVVADVLRWLGLDDVMDPSGTESSILGPITITAIPEPGSIIALGCFLASGLMLRKR